MSPDDAEIFLRKIGHVEDDQIDLAAAALAFAARARAEAGHARYREHLAELAADAAGSSLGAGELDLAARLGVLRHVLVDLHGYRGDRETYEDLRNADLAHVIDRRRGLPVALAILWLHTGRSQGWSMAGINFPGHFLIQVDAGGERALIDPFNAGQSLDTLELRKMIKALGGAEAELAPDHYATLSNRGILLRLQNNIKARLAKRNDAAGALTIVQGMLLVCPAKAELWREAGALQAQLENLRAAVDHLTRAADLAESAPARQRIAGELAALRSKLN